MVSSHYSSQSRDNMVTHAWELKQQDEKFLRIKKVTKTRKRTCCCPSYSLACNAYGWNLSSEYQSTIKAFFLTQH
jgi:hypothetical protein